MNDTGDIETVKRKVREWEEQVEKAESNKASIEHLKSKKRKGGSKDALTAAESTLATAQYELQLQREHLSKIEADSKQRAKDTKDSQAIVEKGTADQVLREKETTENTNISGEKVAIGKAVAENAVHEKAATARVPTVQANVASNGVVATVNTSDNARAGTAVNHAKSSESDNPHASKNSTPAAAADIPNTSAIHGTADFVATASGVPASDTAAATGTANLPKTSNSVLTINAMQGATNIAPTTNSNVAATASDMSNTKSTNTAATQATNTSKTSSAASESPVTGAVPSSGNVSNVKDNDADGSGTNAEAKKEVKKAKEKETTKAKKTVGDFGELSLNEQEVEVNKAIDEWLKTQKSIPLTIRRAVRDKQELGQRAAGTSRLLSLHFLTTAALNIICLYHARNDKKGGKIDGQEGDYKVAGIPLPRKVNEHKSDKVERIKGHLHCGCNEDDALADFFIWKYWEAESGGYREGMKDKVMDPRTRCFVVTAGLNQYARIFVDDLFTNGRSEREAEKDLVRKQIGRLQKDLDEMESADEDAFRPYKTKK